MVKEPVGVRLEGLVTPSSSRVKDVPEKAEEKAPETVMVTGDVEDTAQLLIEREVVTPLMVGLQPVKAVLVKTTAVGNMISILPP